MTRKDYVAIAAVVKQAVENYGTDNNALIDITQGLADVFAADNPAFDQDRFMTAAGFQS